MDGYGRREAERLDHKDNPGVKKRSVKNLPLTPERQ